MKLAEIANRWRFCSRAFEQSCGVGGKHSGYLVGKLVCMFVLIFGYRDMFLQQFSSITLQNLLAFALYQSEDD